ncbi:unknown [Porcine lymphotropic herpesvirus 2]|uniref:Tegument protein UL14 n=1 Tax=Suid gammaherpesvirus 4 TaxID=1960250 RepID=Q8B3V8_9GAMA|nr:unknown [Porcine lymphotropic herpesvirus 2]AAO12376.1 unknown [Porcine lymphotropic herpesvirus 2]
MEGPVLTKEQVLKNLEIAVNKQVSVSAADRFGKGNSLFRAQFQFTTNLIRNQQKRDHERSLQMKLCSLESQIRQKQSEIATLSSIDLKKIVHLEKLTDRADELRDTLEFELERQAIEENGGARDELSGLQPDIDNIIVDWRLERLPKCPQS